MEKNKWLKNNLSWVLLSFVSLLFIFQMINTCNSPHSTPTEDRLRQINDSLSKVLINNTYRVDSFLSNIDTITIIQQDIIDRRTVINKNYTNEIYKVVNADYVRDDSDYKRALLFSDSLFKSGHYYRTYELRETAVYP
jgi:hypothetical protein